MAVPPINRLIKLPIHIPLWKRPIPRYPLYWKGNPQLRIFMPLFWVRPVKAKTETPPNIVHFEVHPQMTNTDVKNYLEKIYKLSVQHVDSELLKGEIFKHPAKGFVLRQEADVRMAYVQLPESDTFEWPDLLKDKSTEPTKMAEEFAKMEKSSAKEFKKSWKKQDIPPWFR